MQVEAHGEGPLGDAEPAVAEVVFRRVQFAEVFFVEAMQKQLQGVYMQFVVNSAAFAALCSQPLAESP